MNDRALTLRELIEQRDALTAQIDALRADMRDGARARVMAAIAEFEFTAFELGLVKTQHIKRGADGKTFRPKAPANPRPPMYRDPDTGATWSGRGKPPKWINGHERDEFLIAHSDTRM